MIGEKIIASVRLGKNEIPLYFFLVTKLKMSHKAYIIREIEFQTEPPSPSVKEIRSGRREGQRQS